MEIFIYLLFLSGAEKEKVIVELTQHKDTLDRRDGELADHRAKMCAERDGIQGQLRQCQDMLDKYQSFLSAQQNKWSHLSTIGKSTQPVRPVSDSSHVSPTHIELLNTTLTGQIERSRMDVLGSRAPIQNTLCDTQGLRQNQPETIPSLAVEQENWSHLMCIDSPTQSASSGNVQRIQPISNQLLKSAFAQDYRLFSAQLTDPFEKQTVFSNQIGSREFHPLPHPIPLRPLYIADTNSSNEFLPFDRHSFIPVGHNNDYFNYAQLGPVESNGRVFFNDTSGIIRGVRPPQICKKINLTEQIGVRQLEPDDSKCFPPSVGFGRVSAFSPRHEGGNVGVRNGSSMFSEGGKTQVNSSVAFRNGSRKIHDVGNMRVRNGALVLTGGKSLVNSSVACSNDDPGCLDHPESKLNKIINAQKRRTDYSNTNIEAQQTGELSTAEFFASRPRIIDQQRYDVRINHATLPGSQREQVSSRTTYYSDEYGITNPIDSSSEHRVRFTGAVSDGTYASCRKPAGLSSPEDYPSRDNFLLLHDPITRSPLQQIDPACPPSQHRSQKIVNDACDTAQIPGQLYEPSLKLVQMPLTVPNDARNASQNHRPMSPHVHLQETARNPSQMLSQRYSDASSNATHILPEWDSTIIPGQMVLHMRSDVGLDRNLPVPRPATGRRVADYTSDRLTNGRSESMTVLDRTFVADTSALDSTRDHSPINNNSMSSVTTTNERGMFHDSVTVDDLPADLLDFILDEDKDERLRCNEINYGVISTNKSKPMEDREERLHFSEINYGVISTNRIKSMEDRDERLRCSEINYDVISTNRSKSIEDREESLLCSEINYGDIKKNSNMPMKGQKSSMKGSGVSQSKTSVRQEVTFQRMPASRINNLNVAALQRRRDGVQRNTIRTSLKRSDVRDLVDTDPIESQLLDDVFFIK